jgi:hypothetical protein
MGHVDAVVAQRLGKKAAERIIANLTYETAGYT